MTRVAFTDPKGKWVSKEKIVTVTGDPPADASDKEAHDGNSSITGRMPTRSTSKAQQNVIEINTDDTRKGKRVRTNTGYDENSTAINIDTPTPIRQRRKSTRAKYALIENIFEINTEGTQKTNSVARGVAECADSVTEIPQLVVPKSQWPGYLRIDSYSKLEYIEILKNKFSKRNHIIERLRTGCFKNFLDLPLGYFHWQLMKELVKCIVNGCGDNELWFNIGGNLMKFGKRDFELITGLNCEPCNDVQVVGQSNNTLKNKFFSSNNRLKIKLFNSIFLDPLNATDDELVQLATLYLLENVVFAKQDGTQMDLDAMTMVTKDEEFHNYPWGTKSYDYTIKSIKNIVKNLGSSRSNVGGFPHALIIWAYEVIPVLSEMGFATRCNRRMPLMLNWVGKKQSKGQSVEVVFYEENIVVQKLKVDQGEHMHIDGDAVNREEEYREHAPRDTSLMTDQIKNLEMRMDRRDNMMIEMYGMLRYTCKTLSLLKKKLGLYESVDDIAVPACILHEDWDNVRNDQQSPQVQRGFRDTIIGEALNTNAEGQEKSADQHPMDKSHDIPEEANRQPIPENELPSVQVRSEIDCASVPENVLTEDSNAEDGEIHAHNEHEGLMDIRDEGMKSVEGSLDNDEETIGTLLRKKQEAVARRKTIQDTEKTQTSSNLQEANVPLKIVSFSKPGDKKDITAPSHVPIREKCITRRSATVREPYTTVFGSVDKEADDS